jgi:hypothetical protein
LLLSRVRLLLRRIGLLLSRVWLLRSGIGLLLSRVLPSRILLWVRLLGCLGFGLASAAEGEAHRDRQLGSSILKGKSHRRFYSIRGGLRRRAGHVPAS